MIWLLNHPIVHTIYYQSQSRANRLSKKNDMSVTPGEAGAAVYSPWFLDYIYDFLVLTVSNTYVWGCPTRSVQLPFYHRHLGGLDRGIKRQGRTEEEDNADGPQELRHLEIGVGTGYYVRHTDWSFASSTTTTSSSCPRHTKLTLMDLNEHTLERGRHMAGLSASSSSSSTEENNNFTIDCIKHDVMQPLDQARSIEFSFPATAATTTPEGEENSKTTPKFDSISLFFLFHCLPYTDKDKDNTNSEHPTKVQILAQLKDWLATDSNPDAVIYGSTILGKGVKHNWLGRWLMPVYNRKGIFGNYEDSEETFATVLRENYEHVELKVVGRVLLFAASRPRVEKKVL